MIPQFTQSGVLPPFALGQDPTVPSAVSPYKTSLLDFVKHFSTSEERRHILRGFLNYRIELKAFGVINGHQWIDGSFVENIESTQNRPPNDIDLVTFGHRPNHLLIQNDWSEAVNQRLDLFLSSHSKNTYQCDAYFVDLSLPPEVIVSNTAYWFGLFSHRRDSFIWKGMLEISLVDTEDQSFEFLSSGGSSAQ